MSTNTIIGLVVVGALLSGIGAAIKYTPTKIQIPPKNNCSHLISHITSSESLIILLLSRPECGDSLRMGIRDSLGLLEAR